MQLRHSWITDLRRAIQGAYFSQYGRKVFIPESDLATFCKNNEFESMATALGHFKRAISYYADKYSVLPSYKHLTSPKIPVLSDIPEFEKALYEEFPNFSPLLVVPSEHKLKSELRGFTGLFTSEGSMELFLDFADAVVREEKIHYCETALAAIERLIFSMAYRKHGTRADYLHVMKAHARLVDLRRQQTEFVGGHWSKVFYPDQDILAFEKAFTFWELPKVVINKDVASVLFNIPKYTPNHASAVLVAMHDYANGRQRNLRFLLDIREEFVLTQGEKAVWKDMDTHVFGSYPL